MSKKRKYNKEIDWQAAQHLYETLIPKPSVREIARQVGASESAIRAAARLHGWKRPLGKIKRKAPAKLPHIADVASSASNVPGIVSDAEYEEKCLSEHEGRDKIVYELPPDPVEGNIIKDSRCHACGHPTLYTTGDRGTDQNGDLIRVANCLGCNAAHVLRYELVEVVLEN